MNILPRVTFFSMMLPLPPPPQYWSKLQRVVTNFLWRVKRLRIKLTTMQRQRQAGRLSLLNFKYYNRAFTLRSAFTWLQPEAKVSWRALEESLVNPNSLQNLLYSNVPISQCYRKLGPIVSQPISVWKATEKLCGCTSVWNSCSPLFNNPKLLIGGQPIQFSR